MVTRQIGPGMIQQMQVACQQCGGMGYDCEMKQERAVLECVIEKGMKHGQKIVLRGEADQLPGTIPGDVVFVLAQEKHTKFLRKNDDLLYQATVPLVQALTGAKVTIKHLDGRTLLCSTARGEILRPDHIKVIAEEGMPMQKNPFCKGNLFIKIDVEFPPDGVITPSSISILQSVLPEGNTAMIPDDAEEVKMRPADLSQMGGGGHGGRGGATDEDGDDDMRGGQRVGCQQQ